MTKKQVYLFACIEKNIGDDLFIYSISKRYKEVEFIISDEARYLKVNSLNNLKYSKKLRRWLRFANNASDNIVKRFIVSFLERIYRLRLKKLNSIYIVGNAFKNIEYKGNYQINWLKRRIELSNNFYLISTNYGPSNSEKWKDDCYDIFSRMTDVCFRDINSFKLFKELNNVRYAPDAVLSININKGRKNEINKYIIMSTIDCTFKGRSNELKDCASMYEEKMSLWINKFNEKGINVILLNSNSIQDNPASERILKRCKYKDKNSIYNYNGNIEQIFDLYENAVAVIGTRLHTIILGWLYEIPVIPIIYDIKVKNLLESYEFDGFSANITDLKEIDFKLIDNAIKSYSFEVSTEILKNAKKQFKKIDDLLNQEEKDE